MSSVEAGPARWREVFAGARGRLTAGLLVLEAVAGVEALVVATILPAVRRDLGDIQLSSTLLMDVLGVGIGAGLSGSCIAVARAAGLDLRAGLASAFAISALSMILLMAIARRLPAARTRIAG